MLRSGSAVFVPVIVIALLLLYVRLATELLRRMLERRVPAENAIDRFLCARRDREEHRLARMLDALDSYVARTEATFRYERHTAYVLAADLGMCAPDPVATTVPAQRNGHAPQPTSARR